MLQCRMALSLLPAVLLMLLMQTTIQVQGNNLQCHYPDPSRGTFRDCMCGEMVRDEEQDCQDETTHYQPTVFHEIRDNHPGCSNDCLNGGIQNRESGKCECPRGYDGNCCEIEAGSIKGLCGGLLLTPNGTITTPGFPYAYPPNVICKWRISTDPNRKIVLSVKNNSFHIEGGTDRYSCDHDYLSIYDGPKKEAGNRIGTYCGNRRRRLETVQSKGRHLYIEFNSNSLTELQGFELHYTTFLEFGELSRSCGPRQKYQLETGIITSPNYPVDYSTNQHCEWEIEALPDHDIVLEFIEMNVPARLRCASGDSITVSKKSNRLSKELTFLGIFCKSGPYLRYTVINPYSVVLTFKSDSIIGGTFKIRYNQVKSKVSDEDAKEDRSQSE